MDSTTYAIASFLILVCVVLPILTFLTFRSGPVSKKAILNLSPGSAKAYGEARDLYLREHGSPSSKPVGGALVSRFIFPPKVYRNGILADFGFIETHRSGSDQPIIGDHSVYRSQRKFVPNDMISRIHPVSIRQHGRRFAPSELNGFQVETKDLLVGIIIEPYDDGRFEEALKQSLGNKWQGVFVPNERLTTEERVGIAGGLRGGPFATIVRSGQAYQHKVIRDGMTYTHPVQQVPTGPAGWEPVAEDPSGWEEY